MKQNGFLLTIAYRNPKEAIALLNSKGFDTNRIDSPDTLAKILGNYVNANKDEAYVALSKIHPDSKIIIKAYDMFLNQKALTEKTTKSAEGDNYDYKNCGGCGVAAAGMLLADGGKDEGGFKLTNTMIISGAVVLSIALITIIIKANK